MKKLITVLASDFIGNNYFNSRLSMQGCPLQRAFIRAEIFPEGEGDYQTYLKPGSSDPDRKVIAMFDGKTPIEDFSFEIEL
jgi:hypothetical protein